MMRYSVGKVQDPRPDDPKFTDWQSALDAAYKMSEADTWVIAIWEEDGYGRIAALLYQGSCFT